MALLVLVMDHVCVRSKWGAAVAVALGVLVGAVTGVLTADQSALRHSDAKPVCTSATKVSLTPLRLVVQKKDQVVSVSANLTARLEGISADWRKQMHLSDLSNCLITDASLLVRESDRSGRDRKTDAVLEGPLFGTPQYSWNPLLKTLDASFDDVALPLEAVEDGSLPRLTTNDSRDFANGLLATMRGRSLVLYIDPCRYPKGRLGCSTNASGRLELVVPESQFGKGFTPQTVPPPTSVERTQSGEATYSWEFSGPPEPVMVRLPLAANDALITFARSPFGSNMSYRLGSLNTSITWGTLLNALSPVLLFLVGAWAAGRADCPRDKTPSLAQSRAIRLTLGYLVALVGLTIHPTNEVFESLWLSLVWLIVAVLWGWTPTYTVFALAGLVLLLIGRFFTPLLLLTGALILLACGVIAASERIGDGRHMLPAEPAPLIPTRLGESIPRTRQFIVVTFGVALAAAFGMLLGDSLGRATGLPSGWRFSPGTFVILASSNAGNALLATDALLIAGLFASVLRRADHTLRPTRTQGRLLALMVAVVAPPSTVAWAGVALPVWLIVWVVLMALTIPKARAPSPRADQDDSPPASELLAEAVRQEIHRSAVRALDGKVSAGEASLSDLATKVSEHRTSFPQDAARTFLSQGPLAGWRRNAQLAAWAGAIIGLLPVGSYLWNAVQSPSAILTYNSGLYLVISVLTEYLRWVGLAFVFGAVFTVLPTRLGATKGAVMAAGWASASLLTELVSRWVGGGSSGVWLYLSLQVFLFLVALGAGLDLMTVNVAGGSARRLVDLYQVHTLRQVVAYLGPVVLAIVGLAQQARAGVGAEFAQQVINSLTAVIG